ncbi:MAG: TrkH family potassium uptake protein [Limisphaerales bacterium]
MSQPPSTSSHARPAEPRPWWAGSSTDERQRLFRSATSTVGLPTVWMAWLGGVTLVALTAELGFNPPAVWMRALHGLNLLLAALYVTDRVALLARARERWRTIRGNKFEFGLLAICLAFVVIDLGLEGGPWSRLTRLAGDSTGAQLPLDLVQFFLLGNLFIQLLRLQQRVLDIGWRPEIVLTGSFALLVLVGLLLLILPRASARPDQPITLVDALFTSTSAVCVTGLTVRDTGSDFSVFGQVVILGLFQLGGLGIMTFVAFVALTSARSMPVAQSQAFKHIVNARTAAGLKRQVRAIVLVSLAIELGGAACLYALLPGSSGPVDRAWWSLFHSVSAFCNAGFGLERDSLIALRAHGAVMLTFMALIVSGGLGFLVLTDVVSYPVRLLPVIRRLPWVRRRNERLPAVRLPVQTRLSLLATGLLVIVGTVGVALLEQGNTLGDQSGLTQFWMAAFQSVTTRTAGFNSLPIDQLRESTLVLFMGLMAIGACPVSTGGGIKTVTFAVLLLAIRAMIAGRARVELFGRTLPPRVMVAALSVFVVYVLTAGVGVFALAVFDPELPLQKQLFEVISALSTVGLSTGITTDLSLGSKLVLCILMFVGRVGPIALVLAVFRGESSTRYQYPEEDLVVG